MTIKRKKGERYDEFFIEPLDGTGMRITARVSKATHEAPQFLFDGTLPDRFIRQSELVAWINAATQLIAKAKDAHAAKRE